MRQVWYFMPPIPEVWRMKHKFKKRKRMKKRGEIRRGEIVFLSHRISNIKILELSWDYDKY